MQRTLYHDEHETFRGTVAQFVRRVVEPGRDDWDVAGIIGREVWLEAGRQGILGLSAPEEHGGGGQLRDYRYRQVVNEELARAGAGSLAASLSVHDDILIPYVAQLGSSDQHDRWLPGMAAGSLIAAIAMTEPGTGSDLRGIRTSAAPVDGGYVINGAKTFITSGYQADLVVTVARTGTGTGARDFSLLVVEDGMAGFTRGRKLKKVGLHAQDTAELAFDDVFVPDANVLGGVGEGFGHLMHHLPLERLSIAASAVAAMQAAMTWTIDYVRERQAFGKHIADFQATRFKLADLSAETAATEALVDRAIHWWNDASLTAVEAARVKLWATEAQGRVIDACLQLHGGYGYMVEYPIARAFQDARVSRISGGTSEIMRDIVGRDVVTQSRARPASSH
ncbi:acyl-CoA dehydrogenase family protein [soil metagenome]